MPTDDLPPPPFPEQAALAFLLAKALPRIMSTGPDGVREWDVPELARRLHDAGWRQVTETRVEWGGRYHDPTGDVDTWRDTRKEAEAMIAARAKGGWRFRSSLIRRFVLVTGPEEVPDAR